MIGLATILVLLGGVEIDLDAAYSSRAFGGGWNRLTATVKTDAEGLRGELRMTLRGIRMDPAVYHRPVNLPPHGKRRLHWDLFLNGSETEVEAELFDDQGVRLAGRQSIIRFAAERETNVLVAGPKLPSLERARGALSISEAHTPPGRLPDSPVPLGSLDTIIFPHPVELDVRQQDALKGWVESGGQLVLFAGRNPGIFRRGFWREISPVAVTGTRTLKVLTPGGAVSILLADGPAESGAPFLSVSGQEIGIRAVRGRGEVVFLRFPAAPRPEEEPVEPEQMWRSILRQEVETSLLPSRRTRDPSVESVERLLDPAYPGEGRIRPVPAGAGLLLLLTYVIAIGPFDYFRLRRRGLLKRGWISFLLYTGAFSSVFLLGGAFFYPSPTSLGHLIFAGDGTVRTYSILRAGRSREYVVRGEGSLSALESPWLGLGSRTSVGWSAYPPSELRLPAALRSRRLFTNLRKVREGEFGLALSWGDRPGETVRLRNGGPVDLDSCYLVSGGRMHPVGPLPAGDDRSVDLLETGSLPFSEWVDTLLETEDAVPAYRRRYWPVLVGGEARLLGLTFYRKCMESLAPGERWVLRQRNLDMSDALDRGATIFVGIFRQDTTRLEIDAPMDVRPLGVLRMILER